MKAIRSTFYAIASSFLLAGALAHASTISGTVTNKTDGKPAAGDAVALLDVQANMAEVAHTTTSAQGHYTLTEPGLGPYLVRVTHQGAGYFIAAPQSGGNGDITVYDVKATVKGVHIEADVLEVETQGNQLKVDERYFVHNLSSPPVTQWSQRSFEVVLPPDAAVNGAGAERPDGLPVSVNVTPIGKKGLYAFNFPIEPDKGSKDTLFQISYDLPYDVGKYTFHSLLTMPADNLAILLPKSMTFADPVAGQFKSYNEDPSIQTFIYRNVPAGTPVAFTISGTGSMPRPQQSNSAATGNGGQPGGGLGPPIGTPGPLSKYKWWILAGLTLMMAIIAAFLLRRPATAGVAAGTAAGPAGTPQAPPASAAQASPGDPKPPLLDALKEELFALESQKLSGQISAEDYEQTKAALETVLKRALKRDS
jgi:hypothetical protein